jgi:carboxypeptidase family protein
MKRKKLKTLIVSSAIIVLLSAGLSSGGEMGDVMKPVVIAGDNFFEWFPTGDYNSIENEFVLFYRISGFLDNDQVGTWLSGINGRIVSYDGDLLGSPISSITTPGSTIQAWAKPAYNPFKNQFMVSYVQKQNETGWDVFGAIIDSKGNNLSGKIDISVVPSQAQHPFIVFNTVRKVFFITWDDGHDIFGIMLKEDGSIDTEEFLVSDAEGDQIFTDMSLNTQDGSCLITWEDFRHVAHWREDGDIYGTLVSSTGEILKKDILVCNDHGTENAGDQRQQHQTYNSKENNFFVVWWDERPTTQDGGIYARIINADGEPAGEDFELVDNPNPQIFCSVSYHEKSNKIFAVWDDKRDADPDSEDVKKQDKKDIYARWFLPDGEPDGPEIVIETQDSEQRNPKIIYNPLMDRFLIAWRNYNVEEEGGGGEAIGEGHISEAPGNVEGMLYGVPSFMTGRVVDENSGAPIENATVTILGIGTMASNKTNTGGWFNISEDNQTKSWYILIVSKDGYGTFFDFTKYNGNPIDMTISLSSK